MKSTDKPTNIQVAVYLANQYRSKVTDKKLRAIAKMYNFKYQVLKRNYEGICKINDVFNNEQQ
jgi:hypothetical protein